MGTTPNLVSSGTCTPQRLLTKKERKTRGGREGEGGLEGYPNLVSPYTHCKDLFAY